MTDKPTALAVQLEHIPQDLRSISRWVMWRYTPRKKPDGSKVWAKVPYTTNGVPASSTNPDTWTSFEDAFDTLIVENYDGIGLVLGDDVQGIDLDDCRNPDTGELSELAQEVLERVEGYAEVSPSGTGIKLFTRTNLDTARTKKEVGVELYREGRYFTVTGQAVNGHSGLPAEVQDLGWFVEKVFGESLTEAAPVLEGDAADNALALYREPLEDWSLQRVAEEVMPHLDPDCGYDEWLRVGQALHHQGQGDGDWLEVWDQWSQGSGKYTEGLCADKWRSFNKQRGRGRGALTLASLLKATKDKRVEQKQTERRSAVEEYLEQIDQAPDEMQLQDQVAVRIAHEADLGDVEREKLARAIVNKLKTFGAPLPVNTVRGWLRPRVQGQLWAQVNDDGFPLCTLDNLRVLLGRLGYTVRYNVIKKAIEILIPGSGFTRDNRDNAAIATVFSECEKVRMPTKHVAQFLIAIADENQHNPVATWVESAPWDGVSRLDDFCSTVRSAGNQGLKKKLLKKWLIQAIAAAFSPDGIANQGILTFVGPQNIGKTTWFQRLAPPELDAVLTGHTLDTRSKDSIFIALSFWLVELGEVDATMRKSDISALKSFITAPHDKIRRPYAATESSFGRRTTFGATVNDEQYLHDPTGNRRFWTIEVEGFDLDHSIDMQQLWAEVLQLWRSGETWVLDQAEVAELNAHNEEFTAVDPTEERLAAGMPWDKPGGWRWATATEALMAVGIKDPNKYQTIAAGRALRRLNGGQRKKSNGKVVFAVPADSSEEDFLS